MGKKNCLEYYKSVNIFKTFEILLAEPISIIHKRIIHILHVETNIFTNRIPLDFETNKTSTQITVFNNKKMYNLLSSVVHKRALKEKKSTDKLNNKGITSELNRQKVLLLENKYKEKVKK